MRSNLTTLFLILVAGTGSASDGVLEINQTCAVETGCFAGDGPGLPVQITATGSYQLTGNLTQTSPNVSVVQIASSRVSLDLNGFAILGTNTFFGTSCSAPGGGAGIVSVVGTHDITVSNGTVRGMGSTGVALSQSWEARVDGVIAEHNCGDGIAVSYVAMVTDSSAHYNGFVGFRLNAASRLSNCSALVNGQHGIVAPEGTVNIDRCVSINNNGAGMLLDTVGVRSGSLVRDSRVESNGGPGINVGNFVNQFDNGSLVLRTSATENGGFGIGLLPVGFVTMEANVGTPLSSNTLGLACYVNETARLCP